MRISTTILFGVAVSSAALVVATDSVHAPLPVPLTRPAMKQALEDMKARKERIPLPELTEADKEKLGERSTSYESRLRYHYMPYSEGLGAGGFSRGTGGTGTGGGFGRSNDPEMGLDYAFTVELFWLVSRTNNCLY